MNVPLNPRPVSPLPEIGEEGAPYLLTRPLQQASPLVFASPHSGRAYPDSFVAAARLDPVALRRSEDGFVDELFAAAPGVARPTS